MALIPRLGPETVYFLKLVDSRGRYSLHEYKIGFTEDDVAERIRQLKTGNPFRITLVDAVKSEAAHFLERRMHARLAEFNTHLEWFEFTDPALKDLDLPLDCTFLMWVSRGRLWKFVLNIMCTGVFALKRLLFTTEWIFVIRQLPPDPKPHFVRHTSTFGLTNET